jgi:dihydropyrimidinase
MASYDLLVKGGALVDTTNVVHADLCIADGKIQAVVRDAAPELAATVVDASGCYVLPGIFDAHVHPIYADSMETLSVSAAHGGITTLIHFIGSGNFTAWGARPEWSLADSIEHFRGEGERTSYLDFAFHAAIAQADDHLKTIPAGVALGVTSFKMFLAYKSRGMMLSDEQMLEAMEAMRDTGALAMSTRRVAARSTTWSRSSSPPGRPARNTTCRADRTLSRKRRPSGRPRSHGWLAVRCTSST